MIFIILRNDLIFVLIKRLHEVCVYLTVYQADFFGFWTSLCFCPNSLMHVYCNIISGTTLGIRNHHRPDIVYFYFVYKFNLKTQSASSY